MSNAPNNSKEVTSSGFGSNTSHKDERLLSKKGNITALKKGLKFKQRSNLYHVLINMPALVFFIWLLATYIVINLFFTAIYLLIGLDGLLGLTGDNDFFNAFSFSYQTLTTVGYGGIHPTGVTMSLVASFEAFIGLLSFAVSTGLLYGRFSKPKSKMLMSEHALISPYKGEMGLMVRVANSKSNPLINTSAKLLYSQIEVSNGLKVRKFYTLDLEMNLISLFATSWTIVHPITPSSPLYKMTAEDLKENNVEIILLISAHDESYNNDVHARTSYKSNEIICNAKFSTIISFDNQEQSVIHLNRLDEYELI